MAMTFVNSMAVCDDDISNDKTFSPSLNNCMKILK